MRNCQDLTKIQTKNKHHYKMFNKISPIHSVTALFKACEGIKQKKYIPTVSAFYF